MININNVVLLTNRNSINKNNAISLADRNNIDINNLTSLTNRNNLNIYDVILLADRKNVDLNNYCNICNRQADEITSQTSLANRYTTFINCSLNLEERFFEKTKFNANVIRFTRYNKVKVLANGQDISNIINKINITLYKQSSNDSAILYTKNINELPFPNNRYIDVKIVDSNQDLILAGKCIYPIKEPLKPNNQNLYELHIEPIYETLKKTIITYGNYDGKVSEIIRRIIQEYLPNVSTSGIQYIDTDITVDLTGWNLFDAINFLADIAMSYFKIGYGRYGTSLVAFLYPYNDFFGSSNITINDNNFTSATPFYYDMSNVYNKVRVIGKPVKKEKLINYLVPPNATVSSYQIQEQYNPYNIQVAIEGRILQGKVVGEANIIIFEGKEEYAYYEPLKTIYFRDPIKQLHHINIVYNVDIPPIVEAECDASIKQYETKQAEDLIFDWIDNIATLQQIADIFVKTHCNPVLKGSITFERNQVPVIPYPGDKIYVNLSRYYIGDFVIGRVTHEIDNVRHWITIETDSENIWDKFAQALRRQREMERLRKKPPPQIAISESDNKIEWKTEFVTVPLYIPDDLTSQDLYSVVELKTIFIEIPFIQWALRVKSEEDLRKAGIDPNSIDWNSLNWEQMNVATLIRINNPDTGKPETMTIDEFKEATGTTWNLNWGNTHDVYKKIWYTNIGSYVENPNIFELVIRITGYGAWKK